MVIVVGKIKDLKSYWLIISIIQILMTTTYSVGTPGVLSGSGVNQGYTTYTTSGQTGYVGGISSGSGVNQGYTTYTTTGAPTAYVGGTTYGASGSRVLGGSSYGTTYVGAPTTTYVAGPTTTQTYVSGPTTTQTYVSGPVTTGYTTTGYATTATAGHHHHVHAEEIPVESRIEYIPFEKKYIEYDRVERIERIPYEQEIVEYEEIVHTERIPIERTITDYYAVETQIEYIPKEIEETIVEYEPVERTWERVQYLPVETQIVHYPEREKYVAGQAGRTIHAGYSTSTHTHVQPTTYQTQTIVSQPTTLAYQTYQNTVPTQAAYQIAGSSSQYGTSSGVGPANLAYQTYQSTVPGQAAYQIASSSSQYRTSGVSGGQTFATGAHGTGANYTYTTGGPLVTSTYTTGGYAQPLSTGGYVTADGTHLSNAGNVVSGSNVKNNTSYATNV